MLQQKLAAVLTELSTRHVLHRILLRLLFAYDALLRSQGSITRSAWLVALCILVMRRDSLSNGNLYRKRQPFLHCETLQQSLLGSFCVLVVLDRLHRSHALPFLGLCPTLRCF